MKQQVCITRKNVARKASDPHAEREDYDLAARLWRAGFSPTSRCVFDPRIKEKPLAERAGLTPSVCRTCRQADRPAAREDYDEDSPLLRENHFPLLRGQLRIDDATGLLLRDRKRRGALHQNRIANL